MNRENAGDLLAFLAVARERSFTGAAAKLGLSQSALSQTGALPAGAPAAKGTYIAAPAQDMTLPVLLGPASARPQLRTPEIMKLSAPPSTARPASRMASETAGISVRRNES